LNSGLHACKEGSLPIEPLQGEGKREGGKEEGREGQRKRGSEGVRE
jgi:hypothetical protein